MLIIGFRKTRKMVAIILLSTNAIWQNYDFFSASLDNNDD